VPVVYKGTRLECGYRIDVLAENTVVVEIKAVEVFNPVHQAQLLTYLRLGGWKLGLLVNFNVAVLKDGVQRYVLGLGEEGSETAETRRAQRPETSLRDEARDCYVNCGDAEAERLAREVLASVVAVQRELGPGLLQSSYEVCLCQELRVRGVEFERRREAKMSYKGQALESDTITLVVGGKIVVHPLAVNCVYPVHRVALLSQLRLSGYPLGFLVNFNEPRPGTGIHRVVFGNIAHR
jgi:GxxExxY protein